MDVLLIENQGMVRTGLRKILEDARGIDLIIDVSNLDDATRTTDLTPKVVIAGQIGREASTEELVRTLKERFPDANVLVLSTVESPAEVHIAFGAGATGYILKRAEAQELIEAVETVARSEDYLQPGLGAAMARWQHGVGADGKPVGALSARQRQVLGMIALGHTNAEIAAAIGVSLRTVEAHRGNILKRLGLKSRADLVKYAFDEGLVSIPEE